MQRDPLVLIEWIGSALQIAGALLLALHLPSSGYAFPLMLGGSILWLVVSWRERRWSLFAMQLVFAAINIVGIVRWLA